VCTVSSQQKPKDVTHDHESTKQSGSDCQRVEPSTKSVEFQRSSTGEEANCGHAHAGSCSNFLWTRGLVQR